MKWKYRVTSPVLPSGATSPVMDHRQMEDWLMDMQKQGWEFVSYAQTNWRNKDMPQEWWIFRKPAEPPK